MQYINDDFHYEYNYADDIIVFEQYVLNHIYIHEQKLDNVDHSVVIYKQHLNE